MKKTELKFYSQRFYAEFKYLPAVAKGIRAKKGVTIYKLTKELTKGLDVSHLSARASMSRWESGKQTPNGDRALTRRYFEWLHENGHPHPTDKGQ